MARRTLSPRATVTLALGLMLLFALLPQRFTRWAGWLRDPVMTVAAPVSGPMSALSGWLRPGRVRSGGGGEDGPELADLRRQRDYYRGAYLRAEQENAQLRETVRALQDGESYGSLASVRRLEASRVGADPGAGTIEVSRGRAHGVTTATVAVAVSEPQHLVGRVSRVESMVSTVQLITDRRLSPRFVEALLIPDGEVTPERMEGAPRCQLEPVGDGTLAGDLGAVGAERVSRGDLAFLDDAHWPTSAQRLIVGRVIRVEETDRPLFRRVVVRPDFEPARVRSVVLRIATQESDADAAGGEGRP
ncbi:MAG TPA: hypothetical protein DEB06_03585 [Phycisphaerales bacterium]|nr:hypothetical protein [Phycisphaerales bacterium]